MRSRRNTPSPAQQPAGLSLSDSGARHRVGTICSPRCVVKMKLRPSVCGETPLPGTCRANITPRTARGIWSSFNSFTVAGNFSQFSGIHSPNRCSLTPLQPFPMMFMLTLSFAKPDMGSFQNALNSSMTMLDLSSSSLTHGNSCGSHHALALRPSTNSSLG